jgi:hypothetical protein
MAKENSRWCYLRIRGEPLKLGIRVSATSIRTVLRREGLGPAPRRTGPSWSEFLRAQAHGIVAIDFLTAETVWLRTMYVLFAIELGSRRVHLIGVSRNPDSGWMTQQARNLAVGERLLGVRFLIRDRDSKFTGPFDEVFRTEGVRVIRHPDPGSEGERVCRAVGKDGAPGVPGPPADPRPTAPRGLLREFAGLYRVVCSWTFPSSAQDLPDSHGGSTSVVVTRRLRGRPRQIADGGLLVSSHSSSWARSWSGPMVCEWRASRSAAASAAAAPCRSSSQLRTATSQRDRRRLREWIA